MFEKYVQRSSKITKMVENGKCPINVLRARSPLILCSGLPKFQLTTACLFKSNPYAPQHIKTLSRHFC